MHLCIQCSALTRSVVAAVKTQVCMYLKALPPQLGPPCGLGFQQSHTGQSSQRVRNVSSANLAFQLIDAGG